VFPVAATPEGVYAALTTSAGIAGWWTTRVEGDPPADPHGIVELTFGPGYRLDMQVADLEPSRLVHWECVAGADPWLGSHLRFELAGHDGGTRVRFWHRYATDPDDDTFGGANFHWADAMDSLRGHCETGSGEPFQASPGGTGAG
jgi:uncharacterized protein YndB with AHSA1/START domain